MVSVTCGCVKRATERCGPPCLQSFGLTCSVLVCSVLFRSCCSLPASAAVLFRYAGLLLLLLACFCRLALASGWSGSWQASPGACAWVPGRGSGGRLVAGWPGCDQKTAETPWLLYCCLQDTSASVPDDISSRRTFRNQRVTRRRRRIYVTSSPIRRTQLWGLSYKPCMRR